jgi:hypothetical protein
LHLAACDRQALSSPPAPETDAVFSVPEIAMNDAEDIVDQDPPAADNLIVGCNMGLKSDLDSREWPHLDLRR